MSRTAITTRIEKCDTQRIQSDARGILQESPYRSVRRIKVTATAGRRLELRGTVPSFYLKQIAQELLRRVSDESDFRVDNYLTVIDPPEVSQFRNVDV